MNFMSKIMSSIRNPSKGNMNVCTKFLGNPSNSCREMAPRLKLESVCYFTGIYIIFRKCLVEKYQGRDNAAKISAC